MILIVDNGSSYINQLCNSITDYDLKRCNSITSIDGYNGVILSGRVENDKSINVKNIEIVRYCYKNNIPLLGICYGSEILALALGGTIRRLKNRVHGYYNIMIEDNPLIDKDSMIVFESHSYIISKLPHGFRSIAYSKNSKNEVITNGNIFGVQFHPELTDDGLMLIENFLAMTNRKSIIP